MDIFTTKESALIHLNSTRIAAGEIRVYRYYSTTGGTDSFVVIGIQDGIGPDCYQILSKRKNLIVNIDSELPDSSRLIQGQIHVCPVNGIYHMVYIEDSQRIDREINDSEVFYVEDFESGFLYYLDRHTCKKLDDYFSKVYIDLSNTNALYKQGSYPETVVTVWRDNADVTSSCQIGIRSVGCTAIYDNSRTIRVTSMTTDTAKVEITVIYRGNTYRETWNIQKVQEGIKGDSAELWTILSKNSFIREPDLQETVFQILYQSGSDIDYIDVSRLSSDYGMSLTYEYSNGVSGQIQTKDFEFEPRILEDSTELTYCIVRLQNATGDVISAITLPYIPNTSSLASGQGVYKAIVFCRSNDMPETPVGGNWDIPIPTSGDWSQDAPEGTEVLWTSVRIFTTDAKAPQDATWSVPSRISNTENLEVMYSTCQDATIVGTPSTKPENWEAVATGIAYFMATRTITNGVPGLWQVFSVHGVNGPAGDYKNYIYYNSLTKPATPSGSHPEGWKDYPDSDGVWWMCVGQFSGETNEIIGTWSNPVKITGTDGDAGKDAPYLVYQYSVGSSPLDAPTYNWSSSIPSVPKGMYMWQRSGTVTPPDIVPKIWGKPVRVTGEQGEKGAPATAVMIDLSNEVSSVAADYRGRVPEGSGFETSQILLYENGELVNLERSSKVQSIKISTDGVTASVSRSGLITVSSWTAPLTQDTATVVVSVAYNYNTYTAVYSIQKVKSGSPGKDAVLYSIIPSTNVLRKVNGKITPETLTAQVRKAVGEKLSNITNLTAEGLTLVYTINGSTTEEVYDFTKGISTKDTEFVTLTLKSVATGSVIDKETVLTIESTIDLIVDLTNELSAVSASEDGELTSDSNFETSEIKIYYGSRSIPSSECQIKASWFGMTGTFDQETGIITPSGWDPDKLEESTGQCTLAVTYKEFTKTVTYTVTKINSGETPTLWSITPSVSGIKATSDSVSSELITVKVYKIRGTERTEIAPANFRSESIDLRYARTFEDTGLEAEKTYETHIPVTLKMNKVEITLYNTSGDVLDRESVYVVRDGAPGTRPDWKDYIFCKKTIQPDTPTFTKHPTSGTADNHGQVWTDGPTSGSVDEIWWMSTATIDGESNDNFLLEGTSWSTPVRVTGYDGTGYECQYTNSKNLVTPPESATWTETPTTPPYGYYTWMRMRSTKDAAWKYMRITGERGSDGNSIIVKGDLVYVGNDTNRIQTNTEYEMLLIGSTAYADGLEMYTGNIYQGQQLIAASRIANGDTYLYNGKFFICTGATGAMNTWQIVNVQGDPGETWMTYVAFASNSSGSDKSQIWSSGKTYMGVAVVNTADYPDWDSVGAELYTWAEFHGQEGIGNEFIFARNDSDSSAPDLNENERVNGKTKVDDEYLPAGWTDDPQPVEDVAGHHVQWVSTRQKSSGAWGPFSSPVVWNRWAKDGTSIDVKGSLQHVGEGTSYTNYILCSGYVHGTSTSVNGDLYLNSTKVTDANNGDTYIYEGYFFICSGTTNGKYDWSVMRSKGDKGDNSYVHIRYTSDISNTSSTSIYDSWAAGRKYIGFTTTNSASAPTTVAGYTWSEFLGHDGPGQEFIYCLSDSVTTKMSGITSIPASGSGTGYERSGKTSFQSDEFLPGSNYSDSNPWTDDPQTVTREAGKQKQWVSTRTKNSNGVWSAFSVPSIWSEIGGSSYSMIASNQELKATYGGIGVPSPTLGSNSDCSNAIANGDCSGALVKYVKDSVATTTNITITGDSGVDNVYVFISGQAAQKISKGSGVLSSTLTGVSQFELFAECTNKHASAWTVTLTSSEGVVKTLNITRTSFEPKITLGTTIYGYNRDDSGTVNYSPARNSIIDITYLSNGHIVDKSVFTSYGYTIHACYSNSFGQDGTWYTATNNEFTLDSIIGAGSTPIDGSLAFEVRKDSVVYCRETIAIISSSAADIDSVKTYLTDGNAAITGHMWAKDGKIGNWIINSENSSIDITYDGGIVISRYDSNYPVGSLRSVNGKIVFDPNESTGGLLLNYTSSDQDYIKINGTGSLGHGNFTWDDSGNVSVKGKITATSGTIGGWKIGPSSIYSDWDGEDRSYSTILSPTNIDFSCNYRNSLESYFDISYDGIYYYNNARQGVWMTPSRGFCMFDLGASTDYAEIGETIQGDGWTDDNCPVVFNANGSGWLAGGMLSWTSDGELHIGSDEISSDYYVYGLDLSQNYLRIGGSNYGGYYGQSFIVDMTSSSPSVSFSTSGSGYHGAGGTSVTLDGSGITTNSSVNCNGLSVIGYNTDHKKHIDLSMGYGLIVGYGFDDISDLTTYSQVKSDEIVTPELKIGSTGCGMRSETPDSDVYISCISSSGGIRLEGGSVIVGDWNSTTYYSVTASAFNQSSDERLKTKISDISLTSEEISKAPAIIYRMNSDDSNTRQAGTIAQYWQDILPEVVAEDTNGNLSLNYSALSAVSVISLAKEIVALKSRIEELENNK